MHGFHGDARIDQADIISSVTSLSKKEKEKTNKQKKRIILNQSVRVENLMLFKKKKKETNEQR